MSQCQSIIRNTVYTEGAIALQKSTTIQYNMIN